MLENMATSIDAGLTIIGRDYRILWGNKLIKQISCNDLENKLCYSVYNRSNKICDNCGVKKVFENGAVVDRHDYNYKFDGRDEWVELIATPVKDKNGNVVAALELVVNITERKRLQTKLGDYSQKLEELVQKRTVQLKNTQMELVKSERLAVIGELAGMIGHDLRNPLTGIKNSAYFLKKKGNEISQAQAQEMLEIIDKCVDYSNKIVNDLLEYSREVHLELHEESVKKLLTESLSLLELPKKIEVENLLNDEPAIEVDPDKIKRVFLNLIKNAVDAMPNGGKITIDSQQINGRLEVSFSDTGKGINDEVLPKLFTPLFTTKAQGMGFGLAICKRIIEAHGGTITVVTVKEKGTSFTITLPIEPKFQVGGENTWIKIPESS
jgi:signal transduction histidine kinase